MFNKEDVDPTCEDFEAQERVFRDEMKEELGGDDKYDDYDVPKEEYIVEGCECHMCNGAVKDVTEGAGIPDDEVLCVCIKCGYECGYCV